jgi:transposase
VWKSSQEIWVQLHEQAWCYFGGSTQYLVLDNLREMSLSQICTSSLNPAYAYTLAHFGVVVDPAWPRDPNRKRTAERAIGHIQ